MSLKAYCIAAALSIGTYVSAETPSGTDVRAIEQIEASLRDALFSGDADAILSTTSPAVMDQMAQTLGISSDEMRQSVVESMQSGLHTYQTVDYDLDADAARADSTITGRRYALVPARSVISFNDGRIMQAESTILIFMDGENWYWNRIDTLEGLGFVQAAYPDLGGLTQTTTNVTELDTLP